MFQLEYLLSSVSWGGGFSSFADGLPVNETGMVQVTVLGLIALWFRQQREMEVAKGEASDAVNLPDKSKLFEALQRLPISFGMAMRVSAGMEHDNVYVYT